MKLRGWQGMLGNLLLSTLSLVFALALAEIGLRLFGTERPLSSEWILNSWRVLDDEVLTVEDRFIGDAYYEPFQGSHGKLVVALGDSFTDGAAVTAEHSYPRVLERLLHAQWGDVLVLSAGLGDTGPDQQLRFFQKYILPRVKPDIVVWQFYANDTVDNYVKPLFATSDANTLVPLSARDNWLYRRQRFYRGLPLPTFVKQRSRLVHLLLQTYARGLEAQVPKGVEPEAWGRRKIVLEIAEMRRLAAEHHFDLYLVLVAPQSFYLEDLPPGSIGSNERLECQALFELLGKQDRFIDARFPAPAEGAALFADESRDPKPLGDRHFNEAGYELLARTVADLILDRRELPGG